MSFTLDNPALAGGLDQRILPTPAILWYVLLLVPSINYYSICAISWIFVSINSKYYFALKITCTCAIKPFCLEFLLFFMILSTVYEKTELHVFLCQIWVSLKICHVPICTVLCHMGQSLNRKCGQEQTWNSFQPTCSLKLHDPPIKGAFWMLGLM